MSKRILIVSDLHLADGHPILDGFGQAQQAAFESLLQATEPGGRLEPPRVGDAAAEIELILNGDVFDLLAIPPYLADGISTPALACEKLARVVAVHGAFFDTLRRFLGKAGRRVTFIPGNHDIELVFAEAQEFVRQAIDADPQTMQPVFSKTPYYRPLADVYVEHGHQYDFWNHARDAWDDAEQPLSPRPETLTLPVGTQYFQRAAHPISVRYPYFDTFDPPIDSTRQIALLCLLNPGIVIETAQRTMHMLSYPRTALEGLAPGEEYQPASFFTKAMLDFAAFQQDMLAQNPAWRPIEESLRARTPEQAGAGDTEDAQARAMREFLALREMLTLPPLEAARAILAPVPYPMGESVAAGMLNVLRHDPSLRYAIAGHTHILRHDTIKMSDRGEQTYFNTASWTKREALPTADEITPELLEWLRNPHSQPGHLRETTRFIFALVDSSTARPATAQLCEWIGEDYHDASPPS